MRQFLDRPFLSLGLLLMWLVLAGFGIGSLLLGLLIVWGALLAAEPLELPRSRVRSWGALIRLALLVFVDIVRSNIAVARIILGGPGLARQRAGFLELDIRLREPNALALLAIIITSTPGTAWLDYEPQSGRLLLHVLDLADPDDWRALIQGRYEALLMEAFE